MGGGGGPRPKYLKGFQFRRNGGDYFFKDFFLSRFSFHPQGLKVALAITVFSVKGGNIDIGELQVKGKVEVETPGRKKRIRYRKSNLNQRRKVIVADEIAEIRKFGKEDKKKRSKIREKKILRPVVPSSKSSAFKA